MGEIADVVGGGTPKTKDPTNFEGGSIPWLTPADLSGYTEKHIGRGARSITQKGLDGSSAKLMPKGTVLFTSRAPIGYVAIAANPISTNQGFKSFVLKDGVLPDYVYWWLKGSKALAESLASGTTFLELSGAKAKQIPIPIAPADQQAEIVAEIEKQFSRLDEAVTNLHRVKANLKRYKTSVLKAAVEGRLVETEAKLASREGRTYETGEQLLKRILETRSSQWKGKGKYKAPDMPSVDIGSGLPGGWALATLEQITASDRVICYGILMPKENVSNGIRYVKVRDLKDDKIEVASLHRTSEEIAAKYARSSLRAGDLLLGIRGTYGRVAEVPSELEGGNITQDSARLAISPFADRDYVAWFLRSPEAQSYFKRVAKGVAVKGVNIADVRLCPVFLPPLCEQRRIVKQVEQRLSIAGEALEQADTNLKRAERLRHSILAHEFSASRLNSKSSTLALEKAG